MKNMIKIVLNRGFFGRLKFGRGGNGGREALEMGD